MTPGALSTAQPGNHSIHVTLHDAAGVRQSVTIEVEVFDFTLPQTPSLPTFWGVASKDNPSIWGAQASTGAISMDFRLFPPLLLD